ncbi:MAG: hypothetical protein R6X29_11655 [Acidimicrobiia bacterium]|jgi:hypothetical protein
MSTFHRSAPVGIEFEAVALVLEESGPFVVGAVDESGAPTHEDFTGHLFGLEVGHPVTIHSGEVERAERPFQVATLPLRIEASDHEGWFPVFDGDIEVVGLSSGTSEIAMEGTYRPPAGPVGALTSAIGLHHLAEEALGHYFETLVERLRGRCAGAEPATGIPV